MTVLVMLRGAPSLWGHFLIYSDFNQKDIAPFLDHADP